SQRRRRPPGDEADHAPVEDEETGHFPSPVTDGAAAVRSPRADRASLPGCPGRGKLAPARKTLVPCVLRRAAVRFCHFATATELAKSPRGACPPGLVHVCADVGGCPERAPPAARSCYLSRRRCARTRRGSESCLPDLLDCRGEHGT